VVFSCKNASIFSAFVLRIKVLNFIYFPRFSHCALLCLILYHAIIHISSSPETPFLEFNKKTQFFLQDFPCYISLPDTSVPHLIHHNELVRFLIFAQHTIVVTEVYDKNKNNNNNYNDVEINNCTPF